MVGYKRTMFACAAKLGSGYYGAKHAKVGLSITQWVADSVY